MIEERYAYSAYGKLTITDGSGVVRTSSAEANRYTYTGREWDELLGLYHYRARMFDPLSGRFTGKDPIGYVGSFSLLYEINYGSPLAWLDPSGKFSINAVPCVARCGGGRDGVNCRSCKATFENWITKQERDGAGWMDGLPNCPCNILKPKFTCRDGVSAARTPEFHEEHWYQSPPTGWYWDPADSWEFFVWIGTGVWDFHPGSESCIRSKAAGNGAVQQCCYDSGGFLITSGTGAGSPDKNDPDHESSDVDPFLCAKHLDGGFVGPHINIYENFRPPNNGAGCTDNPTPAQ